MSEEDDLPGDAEANPLALRSSDTQLDVGRPGNRLVSRAASDALASLQSLSDKRWQVGEFALREQDYRQLQIWLEHLNSNGRTWTLEEFVSEALSGFEEDDERGEVIADGKILILDLGEMGFTELDLSGVPDLALLSCEGNPLKDLELHSVPSLTELWCSGNQLTELDLSSVPDLTMLGLDQNQLTELDLSSVPNLTELRCDYNQLTALQLSKVPNLTSLHCYGNQLTELDIRNCPNLLNITCDPGVLVRKRSDQSVERIG